MYVCVQCRMVPYGYTFYMYRKNWVMLDFCRIFAIQYWGAAWFCISPIWLICSLRNTEKFFQKFNMKFPSPYAIRWCEDIAKKVQLCTNNALWHRMELSGAARPHALHRTEPYVVWTGIQAFDSATRCWHGGGGDKLVDTNDTRNDAC